ncbi:hypothetical protein ACP70R_037759 [Stipagrostis hirtigluma subsp. patula]
MGRNAKRRQSRRPLPDQPPHEATWLGHDGIILVLFETPSGFALFRFDGFYLCLPDALENIWVNFTSKSRANKVICRLDFKIFKDKASAINNKTGVNDQLAGMISKSILPGQKLAVGNENYQNIIEKNLVGIYCLYNDAVLEVMWGLKNLMKSLVPGENSDFPTDDDPYPRMSRGMKMLLDRNGYVVEPEMVNGNMIEMSAALHNCDICVERHTDILRRMATIIVEKSNINCEKWGIQKMATALLVLCYPHMEVKTGDSTEMFSEVEVMKLRDAAPQYKGKLDKRSCSVIYENVIWVSKAKTEVKSHLSLLIGEAQETDEAKHAGSEKPSELLPRNGLIGEEGAGGI